MFFAHVYNRLGENDRKDIHSFFQSSPLKSMNACRVRVTLINPDPLCITPEFEIIERLSLFIYGHLTMTAIYYYIILSIKWRSLMFFLSNLYKMSKRRKEIMELKQSDKLGAYVDLSRLVSLSTPCLNTLSCSPRFFVFTVVGNCNSLSAVRYRHHGYGINNAIAFARW